MAILVHNDIQFFIVSKKSIFIDTVNYDVIPSVDSLKSVPFHCSAGSVVGSGPGRPERNSIIRSSKTTDMPSHGTSSRSWHPTRQARLPPLPPEQAVAGCVLGGRRSAAESAYQPLPARPTRSPGSSGKRNTTVGPGIDKLSFGTAANEPACLECAPIVARAHGSPRVSVNFPPQVGALRDALSPGPGRA